MGTTIDNQLKETYVSWNAINGLYASWAKQTGMTFHSLFTLYAIYNDRDHCCQSKICDEWVVPKQTVSSILKKFEQKGYIAYQADPKDKRNKIIQLTDSGLLYAKEILDPLYQLEISVLENMGSERRQNMVDGNNLFCHLLKKEIIGGREE